MSDILDILICPICSAKLTYDGGSLKCPMRHTFDISKSGYVNLLPPGKGRNAHTGDERDMVKARAEFLSHGYYDSLDMRSAEIIRDYLPANEITLIDLGAGEGRHTLNVTSELIRHDRKVQAIGFDASKYAVECGMKKAFAAGLSSRNPYDSDKSPLVFIPANIFSLPVCDNCADVCISMFAPIPWDEARRVMKKSSQSLLIVLSSGKNHLIELRSLIYDNVSISDSHPTANEYFKLVDTSELCYNVHIDNGDDIKNLFTMTPFYYKTTEEGKNRLYSHTQLDVTVDVNYTIYSLI